MPMIQPPSALLKDVYLQSGSDLTDATHENVAKKLLLPANEVRMWLEHLQNIRKRGATETRRC